MKKIIVYILLLCSAFSTAVLVSPTTYATDSIKVSVTERIPGAGCDKTPKADGTYDCNIKT